MEIRVLKEEKNEMEIAVKDEKTVVSLLRKYLSEDETVDFVAFREEHPLEGDIVLFVRVKDGAPREAVVRALKRIEADLQTFAKQFKEAVK